MDFMEPDLMAHLRAVDAGDLVFCHRYALAAGAVCSWAGLPTCEHGELTFVLPRAICDLGGYFWVSSVNSPGTIRCASLRFCAAITSSSTGWEFFTLLGRAITNTVGCAPDDSLSRLYYSLSTMLSASRRTKPGRLSCAPKRSGSSMTAKGRRSPTPMVRVGPLQWFSCA